MKKTIYCILILTLTLSLISPWVFSASESTCVYFKVPKHWNGFTRVYCNIYEYGGEPLVNWQSKKALCDYDEERGVYTYDTTLSGEISEDKHYTLIFSTDSLQSHTEVLFSTECLGDTLYCTDEIYDTPQGMHNCVAYWENQSPLKYGPVMHFTSEGTIQGTALPPHKAPYDMLISFLADGHLDSARIYSEKSDQELIDEIAQALDLSDNDIRKALKESRTDAIWASASTTIGDADLSGEVNIKDATLVQKHTAKLSEITAAAQVYADTDKDNRVTIKDATLIQKHIAKILYLF